ncbi:ABC transporter permease subunit [Lentzea sp. NPDC051213]|uniref:ABC transporter permease subunit n=1 Tax=Lentzea sp. NPDC051213 TaxID=3364126 RepID=UPI003793F8BA
MTWIVWRQQRPVFITLLVALVAGVAAVLLWRAGMIADIAARGIAGCVTGGVEGCGGRTAMEFQNAWFDKMHIAQGLVLALPALVGVFIGAPLFAREFEQGTHALAFTQSVSRTRWLATKFVVAAVPALVVVVVLQVVVHSWLDAAGKLGPLASGPFYFTTFEAAGVSPIAYTLFAYTFGMFAGALFKRTLVAMSLTLGVFVVLRFVLNGTREFLLTPERVVSADPTKPAVADRGPLVVESGFLDSSGGVVTDAVPKMNCGSRGNEPVVTDLVACYQQNGLAKSYADVIPAAQASTLHLAEASIFAGLAVLFVLGSVWAVRRQM